jgi:hypothetical protein
MTGISGMGCPLRRALNNGTSRVIFKNFIQKWKILG